MKYYVEFDMDKKHCLYCPLRNTYDDTCKIQSNMQVDTWGAQLKKCPLQEQEVINNMLSNFEILNEIQKEVLERQAKCFLTAYNMEVEKAKSFNQGEIKGLELAMQIVRVLGKNQIVLDKSEIENVIAIRQDKYITFKNGYYITVEKTKENSNG
jgi:hypothetical protein